MNDTLSYLLNQSSIEWGSGENFVLGASFTVSLLNKRKKRITIVSSHIEFADALVHSLKSYSGMMTLWNSGEYGKVYRPGFGSVVTVGKVPNDTEDEFVVMICSVWRGETEGVVNQELATQKHMLRHGLLRREMQNRMLELENDDGDYILAMVSFGKNDSKVDLQPLGVTNQIFLTTAFEAMVNGHFTIADTEKIRVGCGTVLARTPLREYDSENDYIVCIIELHGFRHLP